MKQIISKRYSFSSECKWYPHQWMKFYTVGTQEWYGKPVGYYLQTDDGLQEYGPYPDLKTMQLDAQNHIETGSLTCRWTKELPSEIKV